MSILVRPFTLADLPAIVATQHAAVPDKPHSARELEYDITHLEEHLKRNFLVAESNGSLVGVADYHRSAGSYHPFKFLLELYVHPAARNQGVGAALFDSTLAALAPLKAIALRSQVREDEPYSLRFAAKRGFEETKRDFESNLDISVFDATPYRQLELGLAEAGVTLHSWSELDSEAFRRELHQVFSVVRLDVPRSDPASPISLEFFLEHVLGDQELLWDASFVALEAGQIVGFTGAFQGARAGWLDQWLTATRREVRGRQIATALKVKQLEVAKHLGFSMVRTDNDSRNAAMLAVNGKLGFVRQPAVLSMLKELAPEG